jgi:hypothetical protein
MARTKLADFSVVTLLSLCSVTTVVTTVTPFLLFGTTLVTTLLNWLHNSWYNHSTDRTENIFAFIVDRCIESLHSNGCHDSILALLSCSLPSNALSSTLQYAFFLFLLQQSAFHLQNNFTHTFIFHSLVTLLLLTLHVLLEIFCYTNIEDYFHVQSCDCKMTDLCWGRLQHPQILVQIM